MLKAINIIVKVNTIKLILQDYPQYAYKYIYKDNLPSLQHLTIRSLIKTAIDTDENDVIKHVSNLIVDLNDNTRENLSQQVSTVYFSQIHIRQDDYQPIVGESGLIGL